MKKTGILLKLSFKFFKKYIKEYLRLLLKPVAVGCLGFIVLFLTFLNPIFALLAIFVTFPCIFYSFWRAYMITYSLNPAAYAFLKNGSGKLADFYNLTLKNEKELALWVSYTALVSLVVFIPSFVAATVFNPVPVSEFFNYPLGMIDFLRGLYNPKIIAVYFLNMLVFLPFNFSTQAFCLKKQNESFLKITLNCYRKIDVLGFFIALFVSLATAKLSSDALLIFLMPVFMVFVCPLNLFWYLSRKNI